MKQGSFGERKNSASGRMKWLMAWYVVCATLGWFVTQGNPVAQAAPLAGAPAAWQKSVSLQSRGADDFASSGSDSAIDQAFQAHANHLTLIIPFQQDNISSNYIYKASFAPSDAALVHAITKAHSLGMKVTLKPHLDPNDGHWRADINPTDRNAWFGSYGSMLNYYATLAQQNRVEQVIVGAELISVATYTSNSDNTQRWRSLIAGVRQRFSGTLTYSANWGGSYYSEEFPHIGFWDALDYIGISAYFELANYVNPSVSQLMDSWNYWNTNKIQPFQQSVGKPVLFTEIGYRSVDGAAIHPWDSQTPGNYNAQEQVNGITALTQFWSNYPWFAGLQYWTWSTNPGCCGTGDTGYEPQNKPGYAAMRTAFDSGSGGSSTPPSFSVTSTSINPTSGNAGTNFALSASFKAGAAASVLVDMELYNSAGQRVYQQFASNQNFAAGETKSFTFNWASPTNQATGQYTLSLGVFSNDWATNYLWSGNAAALAITTGSTQPTPTPTPPPPGTPTPTATPTPPPNPGTLDIWWPTSGVTVSGIQPFKARMSNLDLNQYTMYWQVDGGQLNQMSDQASDGGYKQAIVDVNGWNWRGNGPYTLNFVAKNLSGQLLQQRSIQIYVQH